MSSNTAWLLSLIPLGGSSALIIAECGEWWRYALIFACVVTYGALKEKSGRLAAEEEHG